MADVKKIATRVSYGEALVELANEHDDFVVLDADLAAATQTGKFKAACPDRFFDVGIAEGHGAAMAAGLARQGMLPVFAVYSSFLQRSYDMLIHDIALQGLHVVLGVDRAGLVGADGESEEGQVWEAAMFAGNQQLDNLCVIVDHNGLQIDGPVEEVNDPMPLADKFRAFKFHVVELADGNDFDQIRAAFAEARATKGQPTAIIAETTKGKGVSFMENQVGWHGKAPNDEQFEQAMAELTAAGEEL